MTLKPKLPFAHVGFVHILVAAFPPNAPRESPTHVGRRSSPAMAEPEQSRLPLELLAYLASSPLPAVAFPNPITSVEQLQAPLSQNQALQDLLGGASLAACTTEEQRQQLVKLFAGRRGELEEIELDLRVPATAEIRTLRFRLNRSLRTLILTATPTSPISFAPPSPSPSTAKTGSLSPSTDCSTTTISTNVPTKPPPVTKPPVFSLPADSPVELQELAAMTWDAPIGLLWADLYLNVLWCNKRWFELAGEQSFYLFRASRR